MKNELRRACVTHGEKTNACRILVGNPEGKIQLGKPGRGCENEIKWVLEK
jgi:hypothetical protein